MPLSTLKPRSSSAIIRNMLAEIESAFLAGASRADVWKTLCDEEGLSCSFPSFAKALMRARQRQQTKSTVTQPEGPGTSRQSGPHMNRPIRNEVAPAEKNPHDTRDQNKSETATRPDRIKTEKDFENIRESTDFTGLDTKYE
jgi:hypothetical protein